MQRLVPPAGAYSIGGPATVGLTAERLVPVYLADAIDPLTGDYASIEQGVDPVEAWVLEQLRIRRASGSAVMDVGNDLHEVRFLGNGSQYQLSQSVRFALQQAIDAGWIELRSVQVLETGDTANLSVLFDNLVSGKTSANVEAPIGALFPENP